MVQYVGGRRLTIDALIRKRKIEEVLDIVDEAFLIRHHGFSKSEVNSLSGHLVEIGSKED